MSALRESFGIGGFDPEHPTGNRTERLDENGYTRWDTEGNVLETRALTDAEAAELAALDAATALTEQAETCRITMRDLTDAFIEAQGHAMNDAMNGQPIDTAHHDSLASQAVTAVYAMKALPAEAKTVRLLEQRADMAGQALGLLHIEKRIADAQLAAIS